ncbi:MAG: hypothetical protein RIR70_162 [Pseudomonadota bacterium]|jgi:apolipoprotein D and lipocalin family protein
MMRVMLLLLLACLAACRTHAPLPTVASVDIPRYMGTWYEIAHLPNRFQADCVADTQAHYQQENERVQVVNRCRMKEGTFKEARGIAHVVADSGNAKLRVSFFRPFYGDYWILALGPDYQWVLVGEPSREYAWVLSRRPQMEAATLDEVLAQAAKLGFDAGAFTRTYQGNAAR